MKNAWGLVGFALYGCPSAFGAASDVIPCTISATSDEIAFVTPGQKSVQVSATKKPSLQFKLDLDNASPARLPSPSVRDLADKTVDWARFKFCQIAARKMAHHKSKPFEEVFCRGV